MGGKTLTRADLSDAVHQNVALLRTESADLVKSILDRITETLVQGETVKLSSFGTFMVRSKGGRIGRNPKTGESVGLAGKYVPHFKPGKELRDRVNQGLERERAEQESAGLSS